MTSLKDLQARFQRAVTEGDEAILSEIVDTSKESRNVLLGVYRNAYVIRLRDILAADYEKLAALLGDDQFFDLARAYLAEHPSQTSNARWFGSNLPEFLRRSPAYRATLALAELAALERALHDAFDAADAEPLTLADLADIPPDAWGGLVFTPHPAVRRLDLQSNAADIWEALHADNAPPRPAALAAPLQLIVSRPDTVAHFRAMAADEAMMWDEASDGVAFSVLCEMIAAFSGADTAAARAAAILKVWIDARLLSRT